MTTVPRTRIDDTLSIGLFLITKFKAHGGGFEFTVLQYTHMVLLALSESLFAINQLSTLSNSCLPFSKIDLALLPLIRMLVSSAKDKPVPFFKQLGKSFTYIMNNRGPRITLRDGKVNCIDIVRSMVVKTYLLGTSS